MGKVGFWGLLIGLAFSLLLLIGAISPARIDARHFVQSWLYGAQWPLRAWIYLCAAIACVVAMVWKKPTG